MVSLLPLPDAVAAVLQSALAVSRTQYPAASAPRVRGVGGADEAVAA